ncbi:MAG TPA: methyltransferase domain-containing protein [Steroidobacteraceae bacterium]|nr:methyltransferase domain-containing protein [Steroidobacteraceae bacterium]
MQAAAGSPTSATAESVGRLGDTSARDYSRKLRLFNHFAEPELRAALSTLSLAAGMRVLDAGCGSGEALAWLAAAVAPDGMVVGLDLATAHLRAALEVLPRGSHLLQADLLRSSLVAESFDLVWSVNTIHHVHDPGAGARALSALLRPGGRLALGQSSLLPDMYFAWDARLERLVNEAVRAYHRDRYRLSEHDLSAVRGLVGVLRAAELSDISVRTFLIERRAPLDPPTHAWLLEAVFRATWGERLRPYLAAADFQELMELCDPRHPGFALSRPDFHFLQTFTLVAGSRPARTGAAK